MARRQIQDHDLAQLQSDKAEKRVMRTPMKANKACAIVLLMSCLTGNTIWSSTAKAYAISETMSPEASAKEARERAQDFRKVMNAREKEDVDLQEEGYRHRREKDAEDAKVDQIREDYVRQRNRQPADDLVQAKMELEDEERMKREDRERDVIRKDYVRKRDERRQLIEHDGQIDEKREYGL